MLLLLYGTRQS